MAMRKVELKVCFWCEKDCGNSCKMGRETPDFRIEIDDKGNERRVPYYTALVDDNVSEQTKKKYQRLAKKVIWQS